MNDRIMIALRSSRSGPDRSHHPSRAAGRALAKTDKRVQRVVKTFKKWNHVQWNHVHREAKKTSKELALKLRPLKLELDKKD